MAILAILVALIVFGTCVYAAGTVTVACAEIPGKDATWSTVTYTLTSHTDGSVSAVSSAALTCTGGGTLTDFILGKAIYQVVTVPGASVSSYTLTITDANSATPFAGLLASRSTTLSQSELPIVSSSSNAPGMWPVTSALSISGTGMGSAKTATVQLVLVK